jgi:hypothetical protein
MWLVYNKKRYLFFNLPENWICVIDSNLNDHYKYPSVKKIRLLKSKLLAKIKLEHANAELSFVYTSN